MPSENLSPAPPTAPDTSLFTRLLFTHKLQDLYRRVQRSEEIFEAVLDEMDVRLNVSDADLARIPKAGATVVVSNHPFGILDGAAMGALMLRVRPDVKILTNDLLSALPEFSKYCIWVDPFGRKGSKEANSRGLKQALTHLRTGGMLVIFPAGEVSHFQMRFRQVVDPEWNDSAARLARKLKAKVLPVLFRGRNSVPFHVAGMIHPMLRTAALPRELLNKAGKTIEVRLGNAIGAEKMRAFPSDAEALKYL
ncbi:MAG: lysophospholipid acyltransferase family protein, partial [Acidobacteriales bacterium]|nr:lysophospholipid acyltransferase family protein [Terriglobales bacterium]